MEKKSLGDMIRKKAEEKKEKEIKKINLGGRPESRGIMRKNSRSMTKLSSNKISKSPARRGSSKKAVSRGGSKNASKRSSRNSSRSNSLRGSPRGENNKTQSGFFKKKYKCVKTYAKAHSDFIEKLIILRNGKIATCSNDFTIKLWDISEIQKKPMNVYKGHTNGVTDVIQYTNTHLISVSKDKTIRKWNISSAKEVYCYSFNTPFLCICPATDTTVCCGGGDKTLRFFDLSTDKDVEELYHLEGHQDIINCLLQINNTTIASGSSDKGIRFWDFEQKKHLYTLEGHTGPVSCMKVLKDKRFASGSYDNTIIIWNIEKRDAELKFQGRTGHILCMNQLFDERIICGGTDWSMIIFNMTTTAIDATIEGHNEAVSGIVISKDGQIISASRDQSIKVWE